MGPVIVWLPQFTAIGDSIVGDVIKDEYQTDYVVGQDNVICTILCFR